MKKQRKDSLRERISVESASEKVAVGATIPVCTHPMPTGKISIPEEKTPEELVYETEQAMLDLSKRDCPICCGEGKIGFDNPHYEAMKPIGIPLKFLDLVQCQNCRGSGLMRDTMEFLQSVSKIAPSNFQHFLDTWRSGLECDEEETESYKDLLARDKK